MIHKGIGYPIPNNGPERSMKAPRAGCRAGMAQETTGSRADPSRIPGMDPIDWERRVALARVRREAALAERDSLRASATGSAADPRATARLALPQRAARPPLPASPAAATRRPPALPRSGTALAATAAGILAATSAPFRHNPIPVALAGALAGTLTVLTAWYATRLPPVETAVLTSVRTEAVPTIATATLPARSPAPAPTLPVAARASLPEALELPATGRGARSRSLALGPYLLAARTSPADLRAWPDNPAQAVDANFIRGLVATALEE